MVRRFLVSLAVAAFVAYAGTEALSAAIAPPQLKIIATVYAHPHYDNLPIARY
ncbi:MAG TPA: hypothetical protein VMA98_01620 [Candidatus Acidoferrales bacterium]|nr:hypothetical protein [Candidatus Acidoferrales bacterium]